MHIISLEASNVKRLSAVNIQADGKGVVIIGGRNGQGKSSVLDSIYMALAGKNAQGAMPVRAGEDKAKIVLDLGDLIVTRTITKEGGGQLKVMSKDGASYASPQAMLDALNSRLTFDPLAFLREKPAAQRDMLQRLVCLDFAGLDAERKAIFDERTGINAQGKASKSRLDAMPFHPDAPAHELNVSDLARQLEDGSRHNQSVGEAQDDVSRCTRVIVSYRETIARLERELADARTSLAAGEAELKDAEVRAVTLQPIDLEPIRKQIAEADALNRQVRENAARTTLEAHVGELRDKSNALTAQLASIDQTKAEAMAAAQFPVAGLAFTESGITMNGIPFENCSSAEQLRVSVAMGIAMNPKLKVLLIRDGSLLDDESLSMVAEMAATNDMQVWIERVGKGKECSVIIEDGQVETMQGREVVHGA